MTAAFVVLCCLLAAALTWASLQLRRGLQRQRRLAGTLTAHLDEGVCLLDHHGRLTFLSPAAERMLDCRAAEMRGKRLRDVLPLPELTQDGGLDAAISRGAPLILEEVRVSRGDGSQLPVSLSIVPIMAGGNVDEMVVTLNDRTDRARAAIHRSGEEYYRTLLEVSPDGIVVADPYGYILMANARAAEMHGYDTPDDLCGMRLQSLVTPELQRPMTEQRQKTINECAARSGEYTSLRKDGATLPTEISTSPVLGDGNQLTALLVVVRDLSARKRAETLLRESAGRESLQQIAADVLAQSASVSEAVPKLLEAIGEAGGWDLGLFWGRDERERVLRCGDAWQGTSAHLSPFVAESREASVSHGSDLLGDVWAKEEPLWTSDGTLPYLRLRVAADAGLRTAVCFPITGEGTFHGVMEFYSRTARPADQPFMQTMSAVGGMLAQFLKRRYAEKQLEYQALHDALTDLPNRTLLGIRLERALSVAAGRNARLAVLLMDL
ncbi:MAG: PAS domain S-box protein, partial [Chloroflexi bacterium]|nr:PAS domain S-box protein [Chloroflexota bacterium]